jgi:hypothetical protein
VKGMRQLHGNLAENSRLVSFSAASQRSAHTLALP